MDKLRILQWNIRSISKNKEYLELILGTYQPDIIVLQETCDATKEGIKLNGYQTPIRTKYSYGSKIRGLSTYVSENYNQTEIEIENNDDYSLITVKIENNTGKEYVITNLHRRCENGIRLFKEHLTTNIQNFKDTEYIIMGDFNLHHPLWDNNFLDKPDYKRYLGKSDPIANLIQDNEMTVLNNGEPTRIDDGLRLSSAIDLTIINKQISNQTADWCLIDDNAVCDRGNSDHVPIVLSIGHKDENHTPNTQKNNTETGYNYKKLDKNKLKKELEKIDWDQITYSNNEETNKEINNILIQALSKSTKKEKNYKNKNRNHRQVPWWNKTCQDAINKKKAASKKYYKNKTINNKTEYNRVRNESNRTIREEKCKHWQDYVSNINLNTNNSETWTKIKNMEGGHNKPKIIPTLIDSNNSKHVTNKEKANLLGNTYHQISSDKNYSDEFLQTKNNFEQITGHNLTEKETNNQEAINAQITIEEFEQALKNKKDTKEGIDHIRYTVYKLLPQEGKNVVLKLLNNIWKQGEIPKNHKHAIIVPILKPGKNTKDPKSYRPISLTSHLGKILETIVNNRLMNYLETNGMLKDTQSGFRQKRQTMDHVARLTNDIEACMKRNKINIAVFLDLQKAFDTVHREGILLELKKLGITGQMYNFIQCFLKDRTFQVKVDGELSDTHTQDNGVPQGSVISPTLFNLLINSLPNIQDNNPNVEVGAYADDVALWLKPQICKRKGKNKIRTEQNISKKTIEKAATELIKELETRGFTVNIAKTQAIIFNKRANETIKSLRINEEEVKLSNTIKYLGVTFDSKLNFNAHIDELLIRANKSMNILHNLAGRKDWGADPRTLRTTYLGIIRSKLTYGAEVYHRANKTKLQELDKFQNRALRIIAGVRKTAGDENKLGLITNIEPLGIHRQICIANLGYRIKANPNNPAQAAFNDNHRFAKKEIKSLNEEFKNITQKADITEDISIFRPIEEHWMNNKFVVRENAEDLSNAEKLYVQSDRSSGSIKFRHVTRNFIFNQGLSENSVNTELISTALSLVMETANPATEIIIITNNRKTIKNLSLEENTDRPETLSKIFKKKTELENIRIKITLAEGHKGGSNTSDEATHINIPLTYNEIKPLIRKKIINNIWIKELQDNPNYAQILELKNVKKFNLDRKATHINHLRLGCFITGFVFPVCPYCEENLTIKHVLETCTIFEETRQTTKKQLKAHKIPLNTKNILNFWKNRTITHIIRSYIQDINDAFKI